MFAPMPHLGGIYCSHSSTTSVRRMSEVAVVTGASSGIGEATARRLAADGFDVVIGARRVDRLEKIANEIGAAFHELDVTDDTSITRFTDAIPSCAVLVNNAGGAFGRDSFENGSDDDWQRMFDVNVMSVKKVTTRLLPKLRESGNGRVVVVSSVAASQPYPGGAGYNAAKFAAHAVTEVLRMETLGTPVRVIEIAPGSVETEFSKVRFDGDEKLAAAVYKGMTPLVAEDIADCISFAVTRPKHVNISNLLVMPTDQASATMIHRSGS